MEQHFNKRLLTEAPSRRKAYIVHLQVCTYSPPKVVVLIENSRYGNNPYRLFYCPLVPESKPRGYFLQKAGYFLRKVGCFCEKVWYFFVLIFFDFWGWFFKKSVAVYVIFCLHLDAKFVVTWRPCRFFCGSSRGAFSCDFFRDGAARFYVNLVTDIKKYEKILTKCIE